MLYGCGDACIGINPASDNLANTITLLKLLRELIEEFQIPTQACVLSHVTTTMKAIEQGGPVDLVFQSIAGTEAANRSFGIDLKMLREAHAAAKSTSPGAANVMYFETGQGSALSAGAHHGVDQQTLEARAYAVMGRDRDTRSALGRAESSLSDLNGEALMPSAFGYNEAQFRFHEGNAYTYLGDVRSADAVIDARQDRAIDRVRLERIGTGSSLSHVVSFVRGRWWIVHPAVTAGPC